MHGFRSAAHERAAAALVDLARALVQQQVVRLPVDEGEEALLLCGAQCALLRWLDEAVIPFEDGREHLQGMHSRLHYSQLHCCYYCRPVYSQEVFDGCM